MPAVVPSTPFDGLLCGAAIEIRDDAGSVQLLDPARWRAGPDLTDAEVVRRCTGPTLDLGCGPGRLVRALREHGVVAWGVDSSAVAVELCRSRGTPVLHRNVFAPLPREGRWHHVLLLDGNIGIGGDPHRLLARAGALTATGGTVIVETDPDPGLCWTGCLPVPDVGGEWSTRWARVGVRALEDHAAGLGLAVVGRWPARPGRGDIVELGAVGRRSSVRGRPPG
ncbi:methyltransferase domain-containing protein [Pseudonocardia spirodelae]|uniref:Methyltransferase domain-containing protein n=1 Tax=Pseudonocardia spirodelae TaxID=3133431 RepID=A0ABU8T6W2_9PSEU